MKTIIIYIFIAYAISINALSYLIVWRDKKYAQKGAWRISEKTIFTCALLGGVTGVWIGMNRFRHKTKTWYFVWGIPLIAAVWVLVIIFIAYKLM